MLAIIFYLMWQVKVRIESSLEGNQAGLFSVYAINLFTLLPVHQDNNQINHMRCDILNWVNAALRVKMGRTVGPIYATYVKHAQSRHICVCGCFVPLCRVYFKAIKLISCGYLGSSQDDTQQGPKVSGQTYKSRAKWKKL